VKKSCTDGGDFFWGVVALNVFVLLGNDGALSLRLRKGRDVAPKPWSTVVIIFEFGAR
jgi:hypothetical protein